MLEVVLTDDEECVEEVGNGRWFVVGLYGVGTGPCNCAFVVPALATGRVVALANVVVAVAAVVAAVVAVVVVVAIAAVVVVAVAAVVAAVVVAVVAAVVDVNLGITDDVGIVEAAGITEAEAGLTAVVVTAGIRAGTADVLGASTSSTSSSLSSWSESISISSILFDILLVQMYLMFQQYELSV